MQVEIEKTVPPSESDIEKLVAKFGDVPRAFLDFLRKHDGAYCLHDGAYCTAVLGGDGFADVGMKYAPGVERFFNVAEIVEHGTDIEGLSSEYMPIASDGTGGMTCLKTSNFEVFFFDPNFADLYPISSDFETWLEQLEPY